MTGRGAVTAYGVGFSEFVAGVETRRGALTEFGARANTRVSEPTRPNWKAGLVTDLSAFRRTFPEIKPPLPASVTQMVMLAAHEALASAGIDTSEAPKPIGMFFNRNRGPAAVVAKAMLPVLQGGAKKMSPLWFSQAVANAPIGALSVAMGLRGPHVLSMGGGALQMAFDELSSERSSVVLCGALEEVEPYSFRAALENGFIGQAEADSSEAVASFGEGAVCFVLESLASARARGAQPLAELVAVEQGLDEEVREDCQLRGFGQVSAAGLERLCRAAMQAAQVRAKDLTFFVGGQNGQPALREAQRGALHALGRPDLAERDPSLSFLVGDGYGMAALLSVAWALHELNGATKLPPPAPAYALLTHTEFHGQHSAVVMRGVSL
ncbi:MAG TPA: beta-ketoacyl synthase N-terminal-like domain-containing protein [Polyangiaceae bacterium]|nr:beta-ketoacyl synthase N-terminal-like domain-containing protein [Polyangiaceae bacterium]